MAIVDDSPVSDKSGLAEILRSILARVEAAAYVEDASISEGIEFYTDDMASAADRVRSYRPSGKSRFEIMFSLIDGAE